jgi:type I restriction enzyme S subunit
MQKTRNRGPDICLRHNNSYIWIEAVAPGPGRGLDAVPPYEFGIPAKVPEEQILLRYTSAIKEKYEVYQKYIENNVISSSAPYIIAVNGGKIPYSFMTDVIPRIIKAVLPIGPYSMTINLETSEIISSEYSYRPEIEKRLGNPVPTNVFLDKKYAGISGVLFSNILVTNADDTKVKDFIFFHNRDANNYLPKGWLKLGHEYWLEDDRLGDRIWT